MNRIIKICSCLMLIMLVFSSCSKETVDTSKFNIVTSFYPMYIATANIVEGVEDVELRNLTATTTGCLHDYQLTTANMITLSTADALIINGSGMETFIDKTLETYSELKVIDSSIGILEEHNEERYEVLSDILEDEHLHSEKSGVEEYIEAENHNHDEHSDEAHHNHSHGENAHMWVSISMYIKQVENIRDELIKLNPENSEKYVENANRYISKLQGLKQEMHNSLDDIKNKNIVTFHEAFEFFAEEFDLEIVAVIEREPGTYPSAKDVADIIDLVKSKDVKAIFVEPQY